MLGILCFASDASNPPQEDKFERVIMVRRNKRQLTAVERHQGALATHIGLD